MFGFLNIYKPIGMTSHDVVAVLRKILKVKQIGHTGTLDPFAQGVLPIAIGKATRLIEYLPDDKEYLATVQFGKSTNTYDIDGETTFESDKKVSEQEILEKLKNFHGEIEQIPPIFSAIKVKGKKLYEYARKGENVEIQPRKVVIYNVELKSFDFEMQQAEILIKCSKGTYIRSIANDLGEVLGCGGHLIRLVRTQAGKFRVEAARQLRSEAAKLEEQRAGRQEGRQLSDSRSALLCRQEDLMSGWQSRPTDITSQSPKSDKLIYPPLEGGSKSLISGWGNVNENNFSTIQNFNNSTNTFPPPQPSPSRGEGDCLDNPSTLQPLNLSTDLINPLDVLDLSIVEVDEEDLEKIKNGVALSCRSALLCRQENLMSGWQSRPTDISFDCANEIISTDNSETSQAQQNDKNLSTLQPFNPTTINSLLQSSDTALSPYRPNALLPFVLLVYNKEKICAIGQIENDKIKLKKVFL